MDIINVNTIEGEVDLDNKLSVGGDIDTQSSLIVEGKVTIGGGGETYEGEYVITPHTYEQVFETKNKTMKDDLTVLEIPYDETTNPYGTTVVIAS